MQSDILFDNIYIGHSVEDAEALKKETFDVKHPLEVAEEEASKPPKPETKPSSPLDLKFTDDPVLYVKEKVNLFVTIASRDPVEAIKFVPEVAGGLGVIVVTVLAIIIGALAGSSAPQKAQDVAKKTKEAAESAKDKAVDAATTGAETVKAEATKRTTRSSAASE